jgi:lysophospholipase L1-like esterase
VGIFDDRRCARVGRARTLRVAFVAGAITCFMLLGASSCSTSQLFSGSGAPKLRFVGDSITYLATDDINAHYGANYDVSIDATVGFDTFLQSPTIHRDATTVVPDIEVIELGTNDAAHIAGGGPLFDAPPFNMGSVLRRFDTFATEFPPSTCVIFVNVNDHNPSWGRAEAYAIDEHMVMNPEMFPHVVDWNDALVPADFDQPDDPHPNAAGRQAMLSLEDAAIASCATASTTTSTTATTTTTAP